MYGQNSHRQQHFDRLSLWTHLAARVNVRARNVHSMRCFKMASILKQVVSYTSPQEKASMCRQYRVDPLTIPPQRFRAPHIHKLQNLRVESN